jgi:hypothetical protein
MDAPRALGQDRPVTLQTGVLDVRNAFPLLPLLGGVETGFA